MGHFKDGSGNWTISAHGKRAHLMLCSQLFVVSLQTVLHIHCKWVKYGSFKGWVILPTEYFAKIELEFHIHLEPIFVVRWLRYTLHSLYASDKLHT